MSRDKIFPVIMIEDLDNIWYPFQQQWTERWWKNGFWQQTV